MIEKKIDNDNKSHLNIAMEELADSFNDNWIVRSLLQALPVIWTVVFQIFKDRLTDQNGKMVGVAVFLMVISCCISVFVIVITNYKTYMDIRKRIDYETRLDEREGELTVRKAVASAENAIRGRYLRQLRECVENDSAKKGEIMFPVKDIFDPQRRMDTLMDEIAGCIEEVSGLSKEKIYLSSAACIEANKWRWISKPQMTGAANLSELLNNESMFKSVATGDRTYAFSNDKSFSAGEGKYYIDTRDKSHGNVGSIICWEIAQTVKEKKLRLIMSISTYGEQIVPQSSDKNEIGEIYDNVIKGMILEQFENEISEILIMYAYLKKVI